MPKKSNPAAPVPPVTAGSAPKAGLKFAAAAQEAQIADKLHPVFHQSEKAAVALLAWLERKRSQGSDGKQQLFEEDEEEDIFLSFGLKHIPKSCPVSPHRIPIPHTLYGRENQNLCLITKDPGKEERKFLLEEHPVANLEEVLGITQLRNNFKQYKDRRTLLQSFSLFLADERIIPLLPPILGKLAFSKKKHPVPVDISKRGKMVAEIEKVRDSALMYVKAGSSISVKVANSSFTKAQILENIRAALPAIIQHIPKGGWNNVKSIHLKTATSTALPLFNTEEPFVVDAEAAARDEAAQKERQRQKELRRQAELRKKELKDRRQLAAKQSGSAAGAGHRDGGDDNDDDDDELSEGSDAELDLEDLDSEGLVKILGRGARDEVEAAMLQLRKEAQERWKHETEGLTEEQIQEVVARRRGLFSNEVNQAGLKVPKKKRSAPLAAAAAAQDEQPDKLAGKRKRVSGSASIEALEKKHLRKKQQQGVDGEDEDEDQPEGASAAKKPKLARGAKKTPKGSVDMLKKISQKGQSAPAHKLAKQKQAGGKASAKSGAAGKKTSAKAGSAGKKGGKVSNKAGKR